MLSLSDRLVAFVAVAVLAAGCGGGSARNAADKTPVSSSPSSPGPVSPSPTPTPTPTATASPELSEAAMRALAERAAIPGSLLELHPSDLKEDKSGRFAATGLCGNSIERTHVSYHRLWNNDEILLINEVHYYPHNSASDIVSQVSALHGYCKTFVPDGETTPTTVLAEMSLPRLRSGIDAGYAYCAETSTPRPTFFCYAYLARGKLLSVVVSIHQHLTDAQDTVRLVVPVAEFALLHA